MSLVKIISFSLWGSLAKYTVGALENAKLALEIYPEWICRYYVGKSTFRDAPEIIAHLSKMDNVQIIAMEDEGDWSGMFWRFLACADLDVDIVLSRDCDSRLSWREKFAVDEWINSGKSFHIMKDHPQHDCHILGGMWGTRTNKLRNIDLLISNFKVDNYWQVDQEFLSEVIFPMVKDDCFIHDEFYGGAKFPTQRIDYQFVGEVFDENNIRNPNHWVELKKNLEERNKWYLRFISKFFMVTLI